MSTECIVKASCLNPTNNKCDYYLSSYGNSECDHYVAKECHNKMCRIARMLKYMESDFYLLSNKFTDLTNSIKDYQKSLSRLKKQLANKKRRTSKPNIKKSTAKKQVKKIVKKNGKQK